MDIFEKWLKKKDESILIKRALTDKSYKNVNHSLNDCDVNTELATYGDAIIRYCYSEIFLDKYCNLSKEIENYITDERFVTIIAKHYNLNDFLLIDENDYNIMNHLNYNYEKPLKTCGGNKKDSSDKFKATAVEAMIGAILKETNDMNSIIELLGTWKDFK